MFTDVDFQVDVLSEEYRLLNPVISKMEKRLEEKQDGDEVRKLVLHVSYCQKCPDCLGSP